MATWAWVRGGKIHWLRDADIGGWYPQTICGRWLDRASITRREIDGCPEGDQAKDVCKRCYREWHR